MKLYFSGVSSSAESQILNQCGIRDYLSDPTDWHNIMDISESAGNIALDSGAYRAFKAGEPLSVDGWIDQLSEMHLNGWAREDYKARLDFITMPDVLGDPSATWQRWNEITEKRLEYLDRGMEWIDNVIPVWQWGAPREHLEAMIRWAKDGQEAADKYGFKFSCLVAIGGCVPWMREKDTAALAELVEICKEHGQWLHILGLNWLEAIEQLAPLARSCDTSKWIDGARYGEVILNENGHLIQLHKRTAGIPNATREELMTKCAKTLDDYCNKGIRTSPEEARPKGRTYTLKPGRRYQSKNPAKIEAQNTFNMIVSEADIRRRQLRQANLF